MSNLFKLSKTARAMVMSVIAVCVALLAAGLLVINLIYKFEGSLPFTAGIMIGCIHSLIKIVLLEKSISRSLDIGEAGEEDENSGKRASNIAYLHYVGRLALTAAVFALAIFLPDIFGLFGTIIGVLSLQAAAIVANFVLQKQEKNNSQV